MSYLPYRTEYAKTPRSACTRCGKSSKIVHKTLRIAAMVQCQQSDKKTPKWYHADCFFMCHRPTTAADISNFSTLKYEDQVLIMKAIDKNNNKGSTKKRAANKENIASNVALKHFRVEKSNSILDICRRCNNKIGMDEVRICKDTKDGSNFFDQPLWYHIKCFKEERNVLHYFAGGESLPGFNNLSKEDQAMVQSEIKPLESDDVPMKKLKADPLEEFVLTEDQNKDKEMEKQNKLFYKYKAALSLFKKRDIKELLVYNCQEVPAGPDECLNHLADIMAFGALLPCPKCIEGKLVLDTLGYKCTGYITEYTKCSYVTQDPKREPIIIHDSYKNMGPFEEFTPKVDVRLFPVETYDSVENRSKDKDLPIPPLQNLQFFLYGNLEDMKDTERSIIKMGGLVVTELTDNTVAVVSTKEDVERMSEKMLEIQNKDIEVVEASYLNIIDPQSGTIANSLQLIKEHNIAQWGSDPASRLSQDVLSGTSFLTCESMDLTAATTSSVTLKIKGGLAVDPKSRLKDVTHVYKDSEGTKYAVTLCQTDVVMQTNKYYNMQVLEKDDTEEYYLFLSWGKTATKIGWDNLKECKSSKEAVKLFEDKYNKKTGNDWINRDAFQKMRGLYYQLDVDYGEEAVTPQVDKDCELALPVQKLITTIFNTNIMKETLLEFQLDTEIMPLGMLSKKQIKSGQEVLLKLQNYIKSGSASQAEIIDATNRFFTLIPHGFGTEKATLLDNLELIKKKAEMLDNLLEIEIAYSLLKKNSDRTVSPMESYYTKLKADITPLDKNSEEFRLLREYARNTHSDYHSNFSLEIEEVFKVVRHDEEERYQPFRRLHNRRLLWHGSRVNNYAGILSQGLRIAPPEAPVTGYMFGKGIYFADMVSKSANYCHAKHNSPGLMLLCEVALGNMKKCFVADENVRLPADKHSVWGVGRTEPDPAASKTLDCGTIVPMGKPYNKQVNTSLLHNEFIVYDAAQVNVKYLVQTKFYYT